MSEKSNGKAYSVQHHQPADLAKCQPTTNYDEERPSTGTDSLVERLLTQSGLWKREANRALAWRLLPCIIRFLVKFLSLRLLDAEAARRFILPVRAAAIPLAPTAAFNATVSPSTLAREQGTSRAEFSSTSQYPHTVSQQVDPPSRQGAGKHASQPRRRGSRGSGACKRAKHAEVISSLGSWFLSTAI
jgi:hypothetical protein